MSRINFIITSQTVPYVDMMINGKNAVSIPVGTMLNAMESILHNKCKLMTSGNIDISAVYDSLEEKLYVEQRADTCIDNFVARVECQYKLKRYIELYHSIIDLIKFAEQYYGFKVFVITLNKSTKTSVQEVLNGNAEIYIAKSVKHVYSQFNKVHPYLLDDADQCNIRTLTNEEIEEICQTKLAKFVSLI